MTSLPRATLSAGQEEKILYVGTGSISELIIPLASPSTPCSAAAFHGRSRLNHLARPGPVPVLTSPLLESLDSPKTSRNFCRLLPITDETCSAASNPGPSAAALGWALETLRREAVTLIRPALLPVPELLLPPGRAGNRHRQLCAILHSLSACDCPCDQRYLSGRNPNPALYINNLYHSAELSLAGMSLCTFGAGIKKPRQYIRSAAPSELCVWPSPNQVQGLCPGTETGA